MIRMSVTLVFVPFLFLSAVAQRPPQFGQSRDPGPNRIEVRFALGAKTVKCEKFSLKARIGQRWIMDGEYASGFEIPKEAQNLSSNDELDLEFQCGANHWHFADVSERAFLSGWWWVGTDYPPFQSRFEHAEDVQDAIWIRYLIVDPSKESGFFVYRFCPRRLQDQKPGPCYEN